MKKNLLTLAITMIIAILATSCQPPLPALPQNIKGFWQSQANSNAIWYGLEVKDSVTAALRTYQDTEELEAIEMTVTYDATTGKGQLLGDGIFLQIQAMTEETIIIKMVEGEIAFTKGQKPTKTYSITGLWKSNPIDDMRVDLLIFTPKEGKISLAYTEIDEVFGDMTSVMGSIHTFDKQAGEGALTASYHEGEFTIDTTANPMTMTYTEDGIERTFTQQPKQDILSRSLQGIWHTSVPGTATATIEIDESNMCVINYSITAPKKKTGKTKGIVHYCQQARMGAIESANEIKNEDFIELFGEEACGVFTTKSTTELTMNLLGIEVVFNKQ
jgi:hypothetical protein